MPAQVQEYRFFKGLTPAIDRKRIAEPYVVDGANFLVDLDGPHSAFGRTWIANDAIEEPRAWQTLPTFDQQDRYHFDANSILLWDTASQQMVPMFTHAMRTQFWPWTRGVCNRKIYFANKEIGLVEYDPTTGYWTLHAGSNIPTDVYACCESYGRLVLLSAFRTTWSKIDDASNTGFAPSTVTGAGFQGLSMLASAALPLTILPYEGGVLAYCKQGVLRGEAVQAQNPFRWQILTREHSLLNPWAITPYGNDDTEAHVFLTKRGLFITEGTRPKLFESTMSEYFHRNLLPTIAHDNNEFTTALSYDVNSSWLAVSYAADSRVRVYTNAFVLYQPSNEWGMLTRTHTGLGNVALDAGAFLGTWYGMCDPNGTVWRFTGDRVDGAYPTLSHWMIDVHTYVEFPSIGNGLSVLTVFSDMGIMTDDDITFVSAAGVWDLQYQLAEYLGTADFTTAASETPDETGTPIIFVSSSLAIDSHIVTANASVPSTLAALDAWITIGALRLTQDSISNAITQTQIASIGMNNVDSGETVEDWLADYSVDVEEDWLTSADTEEDWGTLIGVNGSYGVEFFGTLDAYNTWVTGGRTASIVPETIAQEGRVKYLAGVVSGHYILVRITADAVGESFHLKQMFMTLLYAGRLK